MGAAEYFAKIKEQQTGGETEKAGAAQYFARKREQPTGQADVAPEPQAEPTAEPTESFDPGMVSEGMKRGVADTAALVGYMVDGANWLMDQIPGLNMDTDPFGGSKMIREGWLQLLDYREVTPETETEKYAHKISEFVGGSLVMGPSMINRSLAAGTAWAETRRVMMLEGSTSVAAGAASQWSGDMAADVWGEENRYLGELAGGLSGPTAVLTLQAAVKKAGLLWQPLVDALKLRGIDDVKAMFNTYAGSYARNRTKDKIIGAIGDSPSSSRNIERSMALSEEIKDFKPTATQASGSEALAQLQNSVDSKSVENISRGIKHEMANGDAVYAYFRQAFPEAEIKEFTAKKVFKKTSKEIKNKIQAIDDSYKALSQSFSRNTIEKGGSRLVNAAREKMAVVREAKNAKYEDLYKRADELGVYDDITDVRKLVMDIQKDDQYIFDNFPGIHKKIKNLISSPAESVGNLLELPPSVGAVQDPKDTVASFRKIHSLYREVGREYRLAKRANDGAKMWHLKGINDVLDDKLAKFDDDTYGDFGNYKKAVDKFYYEEYQNVFKEGIGADILGTGAKGATPEGLIVRNKILTSGSSNGLDQFNKLYGDVPEAHQLLTDGILDEFARKTVKQGKLSQSSIDTFMRDYNEVLDKLPDLKSTFANAQEMTDILARRSKKLIQRRKLFTKNEASKYLKIAGFDNIKGAVEHSLTDKTSMRILLRSAKTDDAKEGLATVFADAVMNQKDPWDYIANNEDILKPIFNLLKPGHYKNLKNTAEMMNILNRHSTILRVNPKGFSQDTLEDMIGTSFPSAFAQFRWATLYNKTSEAYVAASIGSKYLYKLKENAVERLIEEALYEPDLAKMLSDLNTKELNALSPGALSRLGQYAISRGIRYLEDATPRALKSAGIAYDQEQQANTP